MDLETYYKLIYNEKAALKYLTKKCLKNGHRFCPRCNQRKLYKLRDERRRYSRCKYTFHDFSGRWINHGRLTCIQWLSLIKLFELELSVRKMYEQMVLSYNTVYNAVQTIRYSVLAHAKDAHDLFDGEIELDESYFGGKRKGNRGRGAAGKVPVFGILERNGQVRVTVVPNVTAKTLINLTVKTVRRGSIIYTDKFKSYDSLMFCGYRHLKIDHGKLFSSGKVYINGLEGFWSWAKERLIKHHGVSKTHFPLYLKELEFRYDDFVKSRHSGENRSPDDS
ncbi:MAG: IS1595 family transposase, partial [Desulfobacterales bacterium]|nr:IS1595 family transposase [Desulfobacterales bacterium]